MSRTLHVETAPADLPPIRRLVLACGNTLRGDDGVAWHIADQLDVLPSHAGNEIITTQQFLPEHAEQISLADVVVFVDCSALTTAGYVSSLSIDPAEQLPRILTHHLDPAGLLRLALDLYGKIPSRRTLITVGGESFAMTEELSAAVRNAIPTATLAVRQALL